MNKENVNVKRMEKVNANEKVVGGSKMGKRSISGLKYFVLIFFVLGVLVFVSAIIASGGDVNYLGNEDTIFYHDFVNNFSGNISVLVFDFETDSNVIIWNGSVNQEISNPSILYWVNLTTNGFLTINTTNDNETGYFQFVIQADEGGGSTVSDSFEFIINATNDIPTFSSIEDNYTYPTNGSSVTYNISLNDEEGHYPLNFSINFTNCTHATWTGRSTGENCSIFNVVNDSNSSAYFNYTSNQLDVGSYNATITISEAVHSCPHDYCDSATYEVIKNVTKNITIMVLAELDVNVSDCASHNFTEGVPENCTIEVRSRGAEDYLNLSSVADFLTYGGVPTNLSWFYSNNQIISSNFFKTFNVTINATHSLVGNWAINFSVYDVNTSEWNSSLFNIFVNWKGNNDPILSSFDAAYNASIDGELDIDFNVTDDDFLIEDKDFYDESISVSVGVVNISSGSSVDGFNVVSEVSLLSNVRNLNVVFSPNSSEIGDYNVTINVSDNNGSLDSFSFNLSVLDNNNPYWNATEYLYNFTVNSTVAETIGNITNLDLNRVYANDSDVDDVLNFTNDSNAPPSFDLSSVGIVNFVPWKKDVGYWEFNATVTDDLGLTNNSLWKMNISNVNSVPSIDNFLINGTLTYDAIVSQGDFTEVRFYAYDNDILISESQVLTGAYNESLTVTSNIVNTTVVRDLISLDFYVPSNGEESNITIFKANFTSIYNNTGNYSIDINVTDVTGEIDTLSFNLSIEVVNSIPVISTIGNVSTSILNESFVLNISATDVEDDVDSKELNYTISAITSGAPDLSVDLREGGIEFNFSNNESYAGVWQYNISVNDSESALVSELFYLIVYGTSNISLPVVGYVFNLSENESYVFNFTIDYSVNNSNLTYDMYWDNVSVSWLNQTAGTKQYNYSNVTLVKSGYFNWNSTSNNLSFSYLLSYNDETYGLYKNITLVVYNSDYATLNSSVNYNLNVTHLNQNVSSIADVPSQTGYKGTDISINLSEYFLDVDYNDIYYNQVVNFTMSQINSSVVTASFSDWILSLGSTAVGTYNVSITAYEWDDSNVSIGNVTSNWFSVTFETPLVVTITVPSSGGGGSTTTVVEHYALKIISPSDITISPDDYVELNFSIYNNGNVDLVGIDLSSLIELGGIQDDDVIISFSEDYIDVLNIGETKDYVLRVDVDTSAVGEYKIVLFGNVTSPEFFDWGEFYVKVQSLDEGQLTQLLLFTEKLVSENPECLELREIYNEAQIFFEDGNFAEANRLAAEVVVACEDAISANEQIRFFDDKIAISLLYALVLTLGIFFVGFAYYLYRRIKFKKSIAKDYI